MKEKQESRGRDLTKGERGRRAGHHSEQSQPLVYLRQRRHHCRIWSEGVSRDRFAIGVDAVLEAAAKKFQLYIDSSQYGIEILKLHCENHEVKF